MLIQRHDGINNLLASLLCTLGINHRKEVSCRPVGSTDKIRPDIIIWGPDSTLLVDVVISHPANVQEGWCGQSQKWWT